MGDGWQGKAEAGSERDVSGKAQGTLRQEHEDGGGSEPSRERAAPTQE